MQYNVKYFYFSVNIHMMDKEAKTQFKWKFYRLTIQLNVIILLVALSVICLFVVQIPFRIFLMTGMLILACILSLDFRKKYRETKAWLDVNSKKDENEKEQVADKL